MFNWRVFYSIISWAVFAPVGWYLGGVAARVIPDTPINNALVYGFVVLVLAACFGFMLSKKKKSNE